MNRFYFKLILGFGLFAFTFTSNAQDTTRVWKKGGAFNLTIAQVGLKNWVGGGQNSLSGTALQNLFLYMNREKLDWTNDLDLGFGLLRQGKDPNYYKSDDKILFTSKLSRRMTDHFFLTGIVDFRTQFAPGYEYSTGPLGERQQSRISEFMAPGYLVVSPGIEYKIKDIFYVMASPFSGKFTFVLDDSLANAGAFGVEPGEPVREEIGAYLNAGLKRQLIENVALDTRVSLFSSYATFGNIDVNWEFILLMRVNKYLTTTVSTQLIYDDDIDVKRDNGTVGPAVQFKEVINVGFMYHFGSKKE